MKLPKQWKYWCAAARLRPHGKGGDRRKAWRWFYMQGRGHVWRINMHGMLQCGDTYEQFDRWALCSNVKEVPMPTTHAEFVRAVAGLVEAAQTKASRIVTAK